VHLQRPSHFFFNIVGHLMRVIQHFLSARKDRVEFLHDPISFGRQSLQVPSRKPVHASLLLLEF
jgi:hypothetical protein